MTWEQVLTLLHVAHATNEYPQLHGIRNKAINVLRDLDLDGLHFAGDDTEGYEE